MNDEVTPEEAVHAALHRRLDELTAIVSLLRDELEAHRAGHRQELVTTRLVVAAEGGLPRIELIATPDRSTLTLRARPSEPSTCVELFAADADGRAHVGVALTDSGDVVSVLEVLEGSRPRSWTDPDRRPDGTHSE